MIDPSLLAYLPWLAILAPITMFWGQTKEIIGKIFRIFVVRVELQNDVAIAFSKYVLENHKRYQLGDWCYTGNKIFSKIERKRIRIGFEQINRTPQIAKINKSFVLLQTKQNRDNDNDSWIEHRVNLYYFRGTFKHEEFIINCLDNINKNIKDNRFRIEIKYGMGKRQFIDKSSKPSSFGPGPEVSDNDFLENNYNRILKYKITDLGSNEDSKSIFKGYVFCDAANQLLLECQKWLNSEEWYRQHGLNWRRGFLVHGQQGSGKTSSIRKICQILDIPLFIFDLASMSNSEFIENWKDIQSFTPCAVIFDDIDKVFDGKENISGSEGGGLSFDQFLSSLSGASPIQGIISFMTANDISKVDETLGSTKDGLMTRPGRIDSIIEIGKMELKNRKQLSKLILGYEDEELINKSEGTTASQFADILTQKALDKFWLDKK